METKLENIDESLLDTILSIHDFKLNSVINFLNPLDFNHVYSIWQIRIKNDEALIMSDSLVESSKSITKTECVLAHISDEEYFLVLFLDSNKAKLLGYIEKKKISR